MRDWASNGQVNFDRGSELTKEVSDQIDEYLARNPFQVEHNEDPATQDIHYTLRITEEPRLLKWSALSRDAINNFRVALDLLWRQATRRKDGFPILHAQEKFETEWLHQTGTPKQLPNGLLKILEQLEPYPGGNAPLWVLAQLDNSGKHAMLSLATIMRAAITRKVVHIPMMTAVGQSGRAMPLFGLNTTRAVREPIGGPMTDGALIYTLKAADRRGTAGVQFDTRIYIDHPDVPEGLDSTMMLTTIENVVRRVIDVFLHYGFVS